MHFMFNRKREVIVVPAPCATSVSSATGVTKRGGIGEGKDRLCPLPRSRRPPGPASIIDAHSSNRTSRGRARVLIARAVVIARTVATGTAGRRTIVRWCRRIRTRWLLIMESAWTCLGLRMARITRRARVIN